MDSFVFGERPMTTEDVVAIANLKMGVGLLRLRRDERRRLPRFPSHRCAPRGIGIFFEAATLFRQHIETEINSANDNPLVYPENASIYHSGHFYGGYIAFAMDRQLGGDLRSKLAAVRER